MDDDEPADDVIVDFALDDPASVAADKETIMNRRHESKSQAFAGNSLPRRTSHPITPRRSDGGPMWSTAKSEDDSSLDGFLPSSSKAAAILRSPSADERALPPPASPFSELFPIRLLSESGVDLADLNQQSTSSSDGQKQHSATQLTTAQLMAVQRTKQPHGEKTHFCTQCCAGFTRRYSLNKHVHEKHALAPMRHCPLPGCTFVTRNVNSLLLHKRNHQQRSVPGKPNYFCKLCRCRYTQRRSLLQHITNRHGSDASLFGMSGVGDNSAHILSSKPSAEETDTIESESVEPLAVAPMEEVAAKKLTRSVTRISTNSVVASSTVAVTDFAVTTPLASPTLPKSRSSKKTPPPSVAKKTYDCDRCEFSAATFRTLFAHRQKQHASKESTIVSCVYCRKQFTSSDRLVAHMKASHLTKAKRSSKSGKRFACDRCEFQTTTKRVFTAHKTMHAVEDTRAPPPTTSVEPVRAEAPTASVAPYLKSRRSPCPMVPTIPHELETVMCSLNQANSSLVQLVKRKDSEIRDLRANVSRLLQLLLPASHPLHPALVRHLITGPQIDQTVISIISSHPAAI